MLTYGQWSQETKLSDVIIKIQQFSCHKILSTKCWPFFSRSECVKASVQIRANGTCYAWHIGNLIMGDGGSYAWHREILTHLPLDKIAAISQTTFWNTFSWIKSCVLWLEFHWNLFLSVQLAISHHWSRWWLGTDNVAIGVTRPQWVDKFRPGQNSHHFADVFKCISLFENRPVSRQFFP